MRAQILAPQGISRKPAGSAKTFSSLARKKPGVQIPSPPPSKPLSERGFLSAVLVGWGPLVNRFLARNKPSPPLPIEPLESCWSVATDKSGSSDHSELVGPRLVHTGCARPGIGIDLTMAAPFLHVPIPSALAPATVRPLRYLGFDRQRRGWPLPDGQTTT